MSRIVQQAIGKGFIMADRFPVPNSNEYITEHMAPESRLSGSNMTIREFLGQESTAAEVLGDNFDRDEPLGFRIRSANVTGFFPTGLSDGPALVLPKLRDNVRFELRRGDWWGEVDLGLLRGGSWLTLSENNAIACSNTDLYFVHPSQVVIRPDVRPCVVSMAASPGVSNVVRGHIMRNVDFPSEGVFRSAAEFMGINAEFIRLAEDGACDIGPFERGAIVSLTEGSVEFSGDGTESVEFGQEQSLLLFRGRTLHFRATEPASFVTALL